MRSNLNVSNASTRISKLSAAKKALLEKRLKGAFAESRGSQTIPRRPVGDSPLSFAQQRLWFLYQLEPRSAAYNLPAALRLKGKLNISAVEYSINEIIRRHEVLRTTFAMVKGQPAQAIAPKFDISIPVIDLSDLPDGTPEAEVQRLAAEEAQQPFDLSKGPLLRMCLLYLGEQAGEQDYVLLFTIHHIVSDGWSIGILIREFAILYEAFNSNQSSPLPEIPIQYADFAVWQQQNLQGEMLEQQLTYWKQRLTGAPSLLELPIDRTRPAVQSYRGAIYRFTVSKALTEELYGLSGWADVTLFMVLLAAFKVLLSRYSGQRDICVGTPIANRTRMEAEGLIGFFANTLVLRTDLSGNPRFTELLKQVREVALGAQTHQELPFERLVEELRPVRELSHSPLFQVMFTLQNASMQALELPGLRINQLETSNKSAVFNLTLSVVEVENGLSASFEYDTDLFDESTIGRMAAHFQVLLEGIVNNPEARLSELPLLTPQESQQLLIGWNATETVYPQDKCLHQLFETQVEQTPDGLAVVLEGQSLTYTELNVKANQLAHYLRGLGIGPEISVGLCVERSLQMIIGILGILKAGGTYVPIDPNYPKERIDYLLEDSCAVLLLIQEHLLASLPMSTTKVICLDRDWMKIAEHPIDNLGGLTSPTNLAYVIYTSGSTGRPKGVLVSHRNVVHSTQARYSYYKEPVGCFLLLSSFAFDSSVAGIFWTLSQGGRLYIPSDEIHTDPTALGEQICQERVTHLLCLPSLYNLLLEQPSSQLCSLRVVIVAGEACLPGSVTRHYGCLPEAVLCNEYGPTEGTVWSSVYRLQPGDANASAPIGQPISNMQIYLLDSCLNPVPIGVPGELYISGIQLARGYLHRPDLTAECFIPNPFVGKDGALLYKTGDLARYHLDGNIEFLGRVDHQVKIRGFRIELGEIEARLLEHPQVKEAVVVAREDVPGEKRLVGYVVGKAPAPSVDELRTHIQQTLPEYMVPAAFVFLDSLPLTPNGKVDRKGLPALDLTAQLAHQYVAPRNATEETLANIWADVLAIERVGVHDNFFALGGHSLLAVTLIERARRQGLEVDVRALFTTPTVAELAAAVSGERVVDVPPNGIPAQCEAITPEMLPLVVLTQAEIDHIVGQVLGGVGNVQDIYPLAPLQEGLLFHHLMVTEGDAYLMPSLLAFDTRARLEQFLGALQLVINRHDILRTAVLWERLPEPVQVVWREAPLVVEEVTLAPDAGDAAEQLRARFDPRHYRLDVREAPLLRGFIARDAAQGRWLLLLLSHHLAIDHTTLEILVDEVQAHVRGEAQQLPAPLPFRNFVAQARLGVSREEHEAFFREMLGVVDESTAPFGLLDVQGDGSGIEEASLELDSELARRLRARARTLGVSAASLCHVAFAQVLARTSGREDVVFGTVLFGRMQGGAGADQVLGVFINTLPVRIKLGEEGVEEAVRGTHRCLAELLHHEHASLALAQRCSAVPAPAPLFSALLNYRYSLEDGQAVSAEALSAWEGIEVLDGEERTNYPVTLSTDDFGEGFRLTAQVQRPIAPERLCGYMHTALVHLVKALETAPQTAARTLEVLPEPERHQLLNEWNATQADYPKDQCIHQLFEAQVKRSPQATAVVYEDQSLTYTELNAKANQLAHPLRALGVGPDTLVGICVERSLEMVIGLLGILKAGGAYLPLDPGYPKERLAYMLEDAQPRVLLTQGALLDVLPEHAHVLCLDRDWSLVERQSPKNPPPLGTPQNLAYVIYTSGSTGKPKGVGITHANTLALLAWVRDAFTLEERAGVLASTSVCFDLSIFELFVPLSCGGRAIIVEDALALRSLPEDSGVALVNTVPSAMRAIEPSSLPRSVRAINLAGEALPGDLVEQLYQQKTLGRVVNLYGPSEATTYSSFAVIGRGDEQRPAIGRPIANTRIYLLDPAQEPVPLGAVGELYVGGAGLARGYLNRPGLTAERFIPNPYGEAGSRLYRTGDLARYRPDGNIEYLGRIDHQVKVRGFRIELGEIEARLLEHPGVREAIGLAREDSPGDKRLVAYVVAQGERPSLETLRVHLHGALPNYMVPSAFVFLEALPLTPNGKVDRKALPAPDLEGQLAHQYVAPRNATEELLAGIWAEVLGLERVGIHDNFFELGGDSILSIQVVSRARQVGLALTPRAMFQQQTVAGLAMVAEASNDAIEAEQGLVVGEVTLTPMQRWFFEQMLSNPHHWNQAVLLATRFRLDAGVLARAVAHLEQHHDALRLRFVHEAGSWRQRYVEAPEIRAFVQVDLSTLAEMEHSAAIEAEAGRLQASLNLSQGPVWRVVLFDLGEGSPGRLLIVIHHLVVDGVSWRILLEDFQTLYRQGVAGERLLLPAKTTSFKFWSARFGALMATGTFEGEADYWLEPNRAAVKPLPVDDPLGANTMAHAETVAVSLSRPETEALLRTVPAVYHSQIDDLLLTALAQTLNAWNATDAVLIELEGHGREALFEDLDVSRTVGWFTSMYPVLLRPASGGSPGEAIKSIKEQLRAIPNKGIGYGLLRYMGSAEWASRLTTQPAAQVRFNYLGQFDQVLTPGAILSGATESAGPEQDAHGERGHEFDLNAQIVRKHFSLSWSYSGKRYRRAIIEGLAGAYIDRLRSLIAHCLSPDAGGYTPSDFPLATLDQHELDRLKLDRKAIEDAYVLSPMQEGMLFHTLLEPHSGIYHMQFRFTIEGPMNGAAFERAWQQVMDGYSALRTGFYWESQKRPHQIVYKKLGLPVHQFDWRDLTEAEQAKQLETLLNEELRQGYNLAQPPLMCIWLFRVDERRHHMVMSFHHILFDAWCLGILLGDFLTYYDGHVHGRAVPTKAASHSRDYIAWLGKQDTAAAERFWRDYLQGFTTVTRVPLPRPGLAIEGAESDVIDINLDLSRDDTEALNALVKEHRLTPNTVFQGALALLLSQYTGQSEVLFGVTVAGRPAELDLAETRVGLFINGLPLRVKVSPEASVLEWLTALLADNLRIREYEYMPLVEIQGLSDIPRGQALFDVLLTFENYPFDPKSDEGEVSFELVGASARTHTNYPLTVMGIPGRELRLEFSYYRRLFDADDMRRLLHHLKILLENIVRKPHSRLCEVVALEGGERQLLLHDWNRTVRVYDEPRDIVGRFEAQVEKTPEACAVACGGERLTYRALNFRANRVAQGLRKRGVGPDALVGLLADRGIDFLVLMLGIFKAGGAYVPLDPAHPDGRMRQVLEESRVGYLVCADVYRARAEGLIAEAAVDPAPRLVSLADIEAGAKVANKPPRRHTERNLAFVIYTSGSTGKPKGAMVEHRGMFNNLITKVPALGLTERDVIAQTASQCFDISVWQFLTALVIGARVEVFPDEVSRDPMRLLEQLAARGVTILEAVPSMIRALLERAEPEVELPALRWLLPCGEAFPPELCRQWMQRFADLKLLNAYGPAECSDDVSYHPIELPGEGDLTVPIGRPVHNTRLYLLNRWLEPVPIGVPGEICVGGVQVGRGYSNRADLTAAAFTPDPFGEAGGRLYRTGDLGRYRSDGVLEFLGRIDHQVKIRGHRIEPGEIEACLVTHPEVREACVVSREVSESVYRLVAYVVGAVREVGELRAHILKTLPEYIVPAAFVFLEALPLTPNGKVDRKRLPDPNIEAQLAHRYVAPRNPTEEILANIWADILGVERVGIHDNFFALGGHSLLATQVISRIRHIFKVELPLRSLFESPTVVHLKAALDRHEHTPGQVTRIAELRQKIGKLSPEEALAQIREKKSLLGARGGVADGQQHHVGI